MASETISIKPNNHRIYQCPNEKKIELLKKLIEESDSKDIVVVCSQNPQTLQEDLPKDIRIIEDKELVKDKSFQCHTLINFDLPLEAIVYIARVERATKAAMMLLDQSEQKRLHQIEILLGRAIKQEVLEEFQYPVVEKKEAPYKAKKNLTKEEIKQEAKKRYEAKTQERKPKKENFKKEFKKDLNKEIKSKDKKKKESAPKKVGRKISIKARKQEGR